MKIVLLGNTAKHLLVFRGPLLFAMAAAGHDVTAIGPIEDAEVRAKLAAGGVKLEVLPFDRTTLNPLHDAKLVAALVARFRRDMPDVFFAYTIKPNTYGAIAARLAGIPKRYVMVTGVGYTLIGGADLRRRALSRAIKTLYRVAFSGCHGVFFQNPDDLAEFENLGLIPAHARREVFNGSGVDLAQYPYAPLPDGPPIVLYMGRLLRDKGLVELADAARIVKARRPDVRFQLLGHRDPNPASISEAELKSWVDEGIVEYAGETQDVRPFLAASTLLVLPSYREGMPRSVLEGLATGRPVVVSDVPGCRETVIEGRNGAIVPPFQAAPLAEAILRTLSDRDKLAAMSRESRRIAETKYDARLVSAAMLRAMDLDHR